MKKAGVEHTIKYIDPSYTIRGAPTVPSDSMLCICLAEHAVQGALAGKTQFVVCQHHNTYVNIPIPRATYYRRTVNPNGPLYRNLIDVTGMPSDLARAKQ